MNINNLNEIKGDYWKTYSPEAQREYLRQHPHSKKHQDRYAKHIISALQNRIKKRQQQTNIQTKRPFVSIIRNSVQNKLQIKQDTDIQRLRKAIKEFIPDPQRNFEKHRIKFEFDPIIDEILDQILLKIQKNKDAKFLDPTMAGGQFIKKINEKLEKLGYSPEEIKKKVFGLEANIGVIVSQADQKKLIGSFKSLSFEDVIEGKLPMSFPKKFDAIVGNPPYKGSAGLHQQFFNRVIDLLKDDGIVSFVQPATPYFNKKSPRSHEGIMRENLQKYKTKVKFVPVSVFNNAHISNDLAVTILEKTKNPTGKIASVEYKNGKKYENVALRDINMLSIEPKIYRSIVNKYNEYIAKHGSLWGKTYYEEGKKRQNIARLPKITGNMDRSDFFTFMSNDDSYYTKTPTDKADFGVEIKTKKELQNVYSYLQTFVARFGLSILKFTKNNHSGEFARVPLVDFNQNWTDKKLAKLIGLTDKELEILYKTLPDHYRLLDKS